MIERIGATIEAAAAAAAVLAAEIEERHLLDYSLAAGSFYWSVLVSSRRICGEIFETQVKTWLRSRTEFGQLGNDVDGDSRQVKVVLISQVVV